DAAMYGEHDAGRENRIDESVGVSDQEKPVALCTVTGIRVIARGLDVGRELRGREPLGELRTEGNGLQEELAQRELTALHVVGPDHCADAGRSVHERDEPEPAVIEPEDGDIAGKARILAAPCVAEMAVHGGAVVLPVAPLRAEAGTEHRIAAGSVDEIAGPPALP